MPFEEFLATESTHIPLIAFIINLAITAALGYLVAYIYKKYGTSISNRASLAKNFVLLAVITMVIITIVKSSLALSLGLVGALSIVRFRAAIKEPEELIYLFLCIAIGLGMGAGQRAVTLISVAFIALLMIARGMKKEKQTANSIVLTIRTKAGGLTIDALSKLVSQHATDIELRRYESEKEHLEAVFLMSCHSVQAVEHIEKDIRAKDPSAQINMIDRAAIMQ